MKKTLALWLCVAALIAACAPAALPSTPAPTSAAGTSSENQPTAAPAATAAPVREEFVATDPATVDLALGRPQFVEFFAFY